MTKWTSLKFRKYLLLYFNFWIAYYIIKGIVMLKQVLESSIYFNVNEFLKY